MPVSGSQLTYSYYRGWPRIQRRKNYFEPKESDETLGSDGFLHVFSTGTQAGSFSHIKCHPTKMPENCLQKGKCSSSNHQFSAGFLLVSLEGEGQFGGDKSVSRQHMCWFLLMWIWFQPEPQMLVLVNQDDSTFLWSGSQPRASGILLGGSSQDSFQWLIGSWWGSGNVGDPFQMAELHRLYTGVIPTTEPSTGSPSSNHA